MDNFNLEVAEYLIDNGALMHAVGEDFQYLAINRAVELQRPEQVAFLLRKGANPNSYLNGETPLVKAIKSNQMDIAKYLIENGAFVSYYESSIKDPLTVARQYNRSELEALLLASGAIDRQKIVLREKANQKARNQQTVEQIGEVTTTLLGIALGVAAVYYANDLAPPYYPTTAVKRTSTNASVSGSIIERNNVDSSHGSHRRDSDDDDQRSIAVVGIPNSPDDGCKGYQSSMGNCYKYDLSKPGDRLRYEVDPSAQIRDSVDVNPTREVEQSIGQYGGVLDD